MTDAVRHVCERNGLCYTEELCIKVKQIYRTMQLRHALVLIGESLSGKSTALKVLAEALGYISEKVGEVCLKISTYILLAYSNRQHILLSYYKLSTYTICY